MSKPPYRALRAVLFFFLLISIIGGLLMILVGKPFMTRLMLNPPPGELSTLFVFLMRELGGILLWMGFILYVVYRDPVRHARVIDASILGLCVLAVTSPLSLYTTDLGRIYPAYFVWGRSLARLAVAALFYYLRPEETPST
jgi:hypothetical protein